MQSLRVFLAAVVLVTSGIAAAGEIDCRNWQTAHPEWIWCDDFESDSELESRYFEVNRAGGRFGVSSESAFGGSSALRSQHIPGTSEAGNVKLGIGRSPVATNVAHDCDINEVFWRFYTRVSDNWNGNAQKVTRATVFTSSGWSQAAIGHLWEDSTSRLGLGLDPASGVIGSQVVTTKYNDFANIHWLGKNDGRTQIYDADHRGRWICVEVQMRLNSPGSADGVFAFWVDRRPEAQVNSLDWRGTYTAYGINAIFLENYVNSGVTHDQARYYDNFIVSTSRIGCQAAEGP